MNGIIRFLLSGLAVLLTAYLLPGVHVDHYGYALLVAVSHIPGQYFCKTSPHHFHNTNYDPHDGIISSCY